MNRPTRRMPSLGNSSKSFSEPLLAPRRLFRSALIDTQFEVVLCSQYRNTQQTFVIRIDALYRKITASQSDIPEMIVAFNANLNKLI